MVFDSAILSAAGARNDARAASATEGVLVGLPGLERTRRRFATDIDRLVSVAFCGATRDDGAECGSQPYARNRNHPHLKGAIEAQIRRQRVADGAVVQGG